MVSDARPICKMFGPMGIVWVALIAYLVGSCGPETVQPKLV